MIDIIHAVSDLLNVDQEMVTVSRNPAGMHGLKFALNTRIFIFQQNEGNLFLDFVKYPIRGDQLFVVPPLHFHYLDYAWGHDFICIELDRRVLRPHQRQLLYEIKYNRKMPLTIGHGEMDFCNYGKLLKDAANKANNSRLASVAIKSMEQQLIAGRRNRLGLINLAHLEVAERFMEHLSGMQLTLNTCSVQKVAEALYCTPRTLGRVCMGVFGTGTREVLNYHLAVKAAYLLVTSENNINEIAASLGFSGTPIFDRYMKRFSGYSPTEIRYALQHPH